MASKEAELEALLYAAGDDGLETENLLQLLEISPAALRELASHLKERLKSDENTGLQLICINQTYKLTTSPKCGDIISKFFQKDLSKNLSQSALEILSIIAYRQPITRVEIDDLRSVNSAGALQTLVWRGLIKVDGKKDVPGHPNLYVTTDYFLQYFNYESLADLPVIEEFEADDNPVNLFNQDDSRNKEIDFDEDE